MQTEVPSTSGASGVPRALNHNNNVLRLTEDQKSLSPHKAHMQSGVNDEGTHVYTAGGIDPLSRCEYTCPFCPIIYKASWHVFREHIKKHTPDWDKPPHSYTRATLMSKKEYHECAICRKTMDAEVLTITNHIQDRHHKMSIKDYRNMNGLWKERPY